MVGIGMKTLELISYFKPGDVDAIAIVLPITDPAEILACFNVLGDCVGTKITDENRWHLGGKKYDVTIILPKAEGLLEMIRRGGWDTSNVKQQV